MHWAGEQEAGLPDIEREQSSSSQTYGKTDPHTGQVPTRLGHQDGAHHRVKMAETPLLTKESTWEIRCCRLGAASYRRSVALGSVNSIEFFDPFFSGKSAHPRCVQTRIIGYEVGFLSPRFKIHISRIESSPMICLYTIRQVLVQ